VAQFVGSVSRLPGRMAATGTVDLMGSMLAVPPSAGADLPVGTDVDVLVRPESVRLRSSPTGSSVIARSAFLGATVRVVATLPDGVEVSSTLPAGEGSSLPPGSRADVELLDDVLFVVPRLATDKMKSVSPAVAAT
jgi:putative spermidine/putrescine transport system ATP-binding protein